MEIVNGTDVMVNLTLSERQLMDYRTSQCNNEIQQLQDVISYRMRESTLGSFLYHLNQAQEQSLTIQQDKLDRVIFDIEKQLVNLKTLERQNDICDNLLILIQELLEDHNPSGIITAEDTLHQLKLLRLTGSKITIMDSSLKKLSKLQALVLAGNCLSKVPGRYLPRDLLLLELCCNRLQELSHLLEGCPPRLLYLGMARNYLTHVDPRISHLAKNLYHLDLAHNDIEELPVVVSACHGLPNLTSLLLIGNPCSMIETYSNYITSKIPKLIFLDSVIIKETCGDPETLNGDNLTGTLQITLFRIMSMPQPITEKINKKKILHSFRIEISCALLEQYVPDRDEFFTEDIQSSKENNDENVSKTQEISNQTIKGKERNKGGLQRKKSTEGKSKEVIKGKRRSQSRKKSAVSVVKNLVENTEYEAMLKTDNSDTNQLLFVSDRKPWGKIIEFPDPTIQVANCDLLSLRNLFRSNLTIRLTHYKTLPPSAKKKKNSKKSKKQNKQKNTFEENTELIENQTKEILISKATVAKMLLPLQDISWNTKSLDFSWSKANPLKAEKAVGLKELQYVVKKKKKEAKRQQGKANENSSELQIPSELTIHIGVGVKRL